MVRYELLPECFENRRMERVVIQSGSYSISVLSLGALLEDLVVPNRQGKSQHVVLKMDKVLENVTSPNYGMVIGRYANRIADGAFTLNGETYQMEKNDHGNALHNGKSSYGRHLWHFLPFDGEGDSVSLCYDSPDGDGGMPGNLFVTVTYTMGENGVLTLSYRARGDKDTVLNLTNHTYFNLSGKGSVADDSLQLRCPYRLEVDGKLIPTGTLLPVAGTPFDFTKEKTIGQDIGKVGIGYDHCYLIDREGKDGLVQFGRLYDPKSGIEMSMSTTLPAVQVYTGNFLDGSATCNGAKRHEAVCFETQFYPDSPHHPDFPSTVLKAGEEYQSKTVYTFSAR